MAESCGLLRLRLCNGCGAGHLHGDFPLVFTEPMLDKLERVKIKYGFM